MVGSMRGSQIRHAFGLLDLGSVMPLWTWFIFSRELSMDGIKHSSSLANVRGALPLTPQSALMMTPSFVDTPLWTSMHNIFNHLAMTQVRCVKTSCCKPKFKIVRGWNTFVMDKMLYGPHHFHVSHSVKEEKWPVLILKMEGHFCMSSSGQEFSSH